MTRGLVAGKVVIVTGAAGGQGAAEARLLGRDGAKVVAADVLDCTDVAASIPGARSARLDVTSTQDWDRVVEETLTEHGTIDVLVNNAGVMVAGGLLDITLEEYERAVAVNQTGPLLGMRAVIPHMKAQRCGSIINICSMAGMAGVRGALAYSTSKWALRGLTKCAALELAEFSIRVNAVHPGRVETPMLQRTRETLPIADGDSAGDPLARGIPLGHVGEAEDIAQIVHFLASDASSFCTGADFVVDGGQTAALAQQ